MASSLSDVFNNLAELKKLSVNTDMIKNVRLAGFNTKICVWLQKLERWFNRIQMFILSQECQKSLIKT